jgi:hypothetical protein
MKATNRNALRSRNRGTKFREVRYDKTRSVETLRMNIPDGMVPRIM